MSRHSLAKNTPKTKSAAAKQTPPKKTPHTFFCLRRKKVRHTTKLGAASLTTPTARGEGNGIYGGNVRQRNIPPLILRAEQYFWFFPPSPLLSSPCFSLPLVVVTQIRCALFPPSPVRYIPVRALHFYREKTFSSLSSLADSRLIELRLPTLGALSSCSFICCCKYVQISPRLDRPHGPTPLIVLIVLIVLIILAFEGYH